MGKSNRSELIKKRVIFLFFCFFMFYLVLSGIFAGAAWFLYSGKTHFSIIPLFILYIFITIAGSAILYFRLYAVLTQLDDFALLDSSEINSMIAKNTAPLRKKYYFLYSIYKENEKKMICLRNDLERLYIKLKNNEF